LYAAGAYAALAAYLKFHKEPQVDLDFIPHSTFRALPVEDNPAFTPDAEVFLYVLFSPYPSLSLSCWQSVAWLTPFVVLVARRLDYVGPADFVHRVAKKVHSITHTRLT
jgi:hypothetical protein